MKFKDILEESPVIAAVKNEDELLIALKSEVKVIFVLFGDITTIATISEKIKAKNKIGILHSDLVEGLSNKEIIVKFIKEQTDFHGIISTKASIVKQAKANRLFAIQRLFVFDSLSLKNAKNHMVEQCDAIEILPGTISKVITEISEQSSKPVVAGGLISTKKEVIGALSAGATCVSSSNVDVWSI